MKPKTRTKIVIVPTCERDKWFSDLAVEGIRKFWPAATVLEFLDTDKSTETDCPDEVRKMCREVPYLRKQVDAPFIVDGVDDIFILDADCFIMGYPKEFAEGPYSYQGHTLHGHPDYPWGLRAWRILGHNFEKVTPLFCAGMFSAPTTMWTHNRTLIYEYLHQCGKLGYSNKNWIYHNVTIDQNLAAGLWRKTCKDNPLPALEYPLGVPSVDAKIFHACYYKTFPEFKERWLPAYKKLLDS